MTSANVAAAPPKNTRTGRGVMSIASSETELTAKSAKPSPSKSQPDTTAPPNAGLLLVTVVEAAVARLADVGPS